MIYGTTSIDEVIGRVIRNTRIQDSSYLLDMVEWIPEAMAQMKTKVTLVTKFEDVRVNFHVGKLPCGLDHITAVEWKGMRIPEAQGARTAAGEAHGRHEASKVDDQLGFKTVPLQYVGTADDVDDVSFYGNDLVSTSPEDCGRFPLHKEAWYRIELGHLQFSVPDTVVRVWYRCIPLDENGFPLIPDEENYKQALYFYTREMMVGAGYEDKAYNINQLHEKFELYAGRAINNIRYPSVDSMDLKVNRMTRLIPNANYFDSFFNDNSKEKYYGNTNVLNLSNPI